MSSIHIFSMVLLFTALLPKSPACQQNTPLSPSSAGTVPHEDRPQGKFPRNPELLKSLRSGSGEPLVIHLMVPLCDNENQGISPVSASLGDGQNLRTNLYWGAGYGVRTHFKRHADWEDLGSFPLPNAAVLERLVFRKKSGGRSIYLVADAYRGDRMKVCLEDLLGAASGNQSGILEMEGGEKLNLYGGANLLAFSGHNGLMDTEVKTFYNRDGKVREVAVIGCFSHSWFVDHLQKAGAFPLIGTTGLMAPEAYVSEAIFSAWALGREGPEIRTAAGAAYHKYQKCGIRGATNLFKTGW